MNEQARFDGILEGIEMLFPVFTGGIAIGFVVGFVLGVLL